MPQDEKNDPSDVGLPCSLQLKDGRTCTLRHAIESDAEELCAFIPQAHTESDFALNMPGEFQMTVAEEREFIRKWSDKPYLLLLVAELDGRIVASTGVEGHDKRRMAHHAEFGVMVSKALWGLGLGRQLTAWAIEWGRRAGLRKLNLKVRPDNDRAMSIYPSLGFVEEGCQREDTQRADGSYADTILMAYFYVTPE